MDLITQLNNVERILKRRAFIGHYIERRRVDAVQDYRDVVQLAPEEMELARDLSSADVTFLAMWPDCFTAHSTLPGPVADVHQLYVQLSELPFGCHWFQIKSVNLSEKEIIYKLKCLRTLSGASVEPQAAARSTRPPDDSDRLSGFGVLEALKACNSSELVVGVLRFLVVLFTTLLTGSFHLVTFIGDFTIRFMGESSAFIKASTPMFLGFLDFISKIVGGFYILLAMLWRGSKSPGRPPMQSLDFPQHRHTHPRQAYQPEFPGID